MRFISIILIVFGLLFAKEQEIKINFKDLTISDFIKMVSKISGKNILITSTIPGKINFISVKPINKNEIYDLLLSVLRNKGYTIVDSESGYLQVERSSNALKSSPVLASKTKINQIQTDIIGLKYISAKDIAHQINYLISRYGKIRFSSSTNTLIVSDYPKNLKTIREIIKKLDKKNSFQIKFYTLKNIDSSTVALKLNTIAQTIYNKTIPDQQVKIIDNKETNSIILVAQKNIIDKLMDAIKKMDKKNITSKQSLHIISLKNSDAVNLAKTLQNIINSKHVEKNTKGKTKVKNPTIVADKETNTLIIYATEQEIKELYKLIDKLDSSRQQVYVSAKIVEISNEKSSKIGAKYGILGGVANSSGLYTFSADIGAPAIPFDLTSLGISTPVIKEGMALGATISLLSSKGAANILSEPSLLCVNNLESSIYVGKTESIITQSSVGAATTDVTKNTYTREDIGLTLKVKPRISSEKKVSLNIKVIMEDVLPGSPVGLPTTTKREVSTTAIVKNGESIIIGGLIKEKENNSIAKVPLLGDIPVLGNVFKHKEKNYDKISLVIILTPYIIHKDSDLLKLKRILSKLNVLEQKYVQNLVKKK